MKRTLTAFDVAVCAGVACLVAATLIPAVAKVGRGDADARCQSNLQRWADAVALYASDYTSRCPSNRPMLQTGLGLIMPTVMLSPDEIDPATDKPKRFVYGIPWVEALYSYLWDAADRTDQDWKVFRRCPNARNIRCPDVASLPNVSMSYTFNRCLIEGPLVIVKDPKRLMMMREFSRLTVSMIRPSNDTTGNPNTRPADPFLSGYDALIEGDITDECRLHGEGSCIVFADGHVHHFTMDYYPQTSQMSSSSSWDPETQQWWNYAPGSGKGPPYLKSIAISP